MKYQLFPLLILTLVMTTACNRNNEDNILLAEWDTPYQTPPFDKIKTEDYKPAFEKAIAIGKAEIDAIADNVDTPTFENTIVALENAGSLCNRVSDIFFNILECDGDSVMQKLAQDIMPMLTDYSNDISLNEKLFNRVKSVYEQRNSLDLTPEQQMLLKQTYKGFTRSGANLSPEDKETYRSISKELSNLSLKFKENLLAETNNFLLHITNEADLAGLPESVREAAKETAKEHNVDGWAFDLTAPSYVAFMKYSENRPLREKLSRAYGSRCYKGNENDNQKIILRMTELRLQLARLLGYNTYADYVLEERMAQNPTKVKTFLQQLQNASVDAANNDIKEVTAFAAANGLQDKFQRWDMAFYSEKLSSQKFAINDEMMKPYFELEKVKQGVFGLANKLWGLTFTENQKISVYHKDVTAYEVKDETGRFMGVLYLDFFPRPTKSGGAWMTTFRQQYKDANGNDVRPLVQVVTNFTKPTKNTPSLLTFDEVSTFLHEFGHAMHGMLSDVTYRSLSCTNVYHDFVELPSQLNENWATEQEFLSTFATHYQTGEVIPDSLVKKIVDFQNFQAGYLSLRQIMYGKCDMAWHSITEPVKTSVGEFERAAIADCDLLPAVDTSCTSTAFSHIFDGGYAAGYYGYKWSEVLDADAFQVFKENGIFDKATAQSYRENILSKGGTENPMDLYIRFRGKEPSIDALLIRSGLKKK